MRLTQVRKIAEPKEGWRKREVRVISTCVGAVGREGHPAAGRRRRRARTSGSASAFDTTRAVGASPARAMATEGSGLVVEEE